VILALFLIVVALQPAHFVVQRSTTINAPAETVFAQVNDFHNWPAWSPWEKLDPDMKRTYDGAASGTGAIYAWSGNDKAGEGRMTLTESRPSELVGIKLEFVKPFAATNHVAFTFKQTGTQTDVNWSMDGEHNLVEKAFCMFMNMDKIVGGDYERGLAQLKTVAESAPAKK
jgi:hypothetical protein